MSATSIPMDLPRSARRPLTGSGSAVKRLRQCSLLLRQRVKRAGQAPAPQNPASKWLIENHSYLQFQIREAIQALPASYLRLLPKAGEGMTLEFRAYKLAVCFVADNAEVIDSRSIAEFAATLKKDPSVTLGELWAFESMLKLVLIERVCESTESEQIVRRSITSLRALEHVNWCDVVE